MTMRKMKKKELEEGLSAAILGAAKMLEDLHVVHCKEDVENFLTIQIGNTNLANIINNLYKIILPALDFALSKLTKFSKVFDWAARIVQRLYAI